MPTLLHEVGILLLNIRMQPNPAEESYWNSNERKSRGRKNYGRKRSVWKNYNQNDGQPGVVYILANDAFPHLLKIGQSTRSAADRARELNDNCGTESPGRFSVLHEVLTADCGRAEKRAHKHLKKHRFGKKEYFEIAVTPALEVVREACAFFDRKADEKKRIADGKPKTETESVNQVGTQAQKPALTPEQEAAIYAGLINIDNPYGTALPIKASRPTPKPPTHQTKNSAPVAPNTQHSPVARIQAPPEREIIACPSCRQSLRIPIADNLILTCPKCRYSFCRTASGQTYSHNNKSPAPTTTRTPLSGHYSVQPMFEQLAPSKAGAPWRVYAAVTLLLAGGFIALSGGGDSRERTTTTPAATADEGRLHADIRRYVTDYQIPKPDPTGETELRSVAQAGATIVFTYVVTAKGEQALGNNLDWPYIQNGMRTLACAKPELRALMTRGTVVQYQLQRKNRAGLTSTIVCK